MQKFQAHKRFRRAVYSWPSIAVLAFLVFFLAKAAFGAYNKYVLTEKNLADARLEYETVAARKSTLEREIERLQTPIGIEEQVRRNFQVAKPGEALVVVTDSTTTTHVATSTPERHWWQKFFK